MKTKANTPFSITMSNKFKLVNIRGFWKVVIKG